MKDPKLGSLCPDDAARDAVHIAIAPVVSKRDLGPGEPVCLVEGKADEVEPCQRGVKHIGIVDPFLNEIVRAGKRFWICLIPGSITSLRHEWTHPDFQKEEPTQIQMPTSEKEESKKWLMAYVRKHCPYDSEHIDGGYESFINYVKNERWVYYHGNDCHGLFDVEDADDLFRHLSVVLDRRIDASHFEAFTCSC